MTFRSEPAGSAAAPPKKRATTWRVVDHDEAPFGAIDHMVGPAQNLGFSVDPTVAQFGDDVTALQICRTDDARSLLVDRKSRPAKQPFTLPTTLHAVSRKRGRLLKERIRGSLVALNGTPLYSLKHVYRRLVRRSPNGDAADQLAVL